MALLEVRGLMLINIQSCVLLEILLSLVQFQHLTFALQEQQLVRAVQGKGLLPNKVRLIGILEL